MLQRAEIALVDPAGPQLVRKGTTVGPASATSSKGSKTKSSSRAKVVSPKLKKDEAIEVIILHLRSFAKNALPGCCSLNS